MRYRTLFITVFFSAFYSLAFAQTARELTVKRATDSITAVFMSEYAKKYPILRQGSFATDIIGQGRVKGMLNGKDLYQGDMNSTRLRSTFNIPVSKWGRNTISATLNYIQQRFSMENITSYDPSFSSENFSITKSTVSFSASFTRSDSLFNHPVNFSGTVSGMTDELSSIKRMNYVGSITVPLKRTQNSSFTLGLIVVIDPSAPLPAFPIVSYWHKFGSSDLELFADLPSRLILRKELSKRSWISAGTEFGAALFFFDLNQPDLPAKSIYSSLEFRSGATFEYLVTKKLILGANAGILSTLSPRMFDKNEQSADYFYKATNTSVPYVGFSLSFLPFLKRVK